MSWYVEFTQLRKLLKEARGDIDNSVTESQQQTNSRILWGFDATSLFDDYEEVRHQSVNEGFVDFWDRFRKINRRAYTIRNTLQVDVIHYMHGTVSLTSFF